MSAGGARGRRGRGGDAGEGLEAGVRARAGPSDPARGGPGRTLPETPRPRRAPSRRADRELTGALGGSGPQRAGSRLPPGVAAPRTPAGALAPASRGE